MGLRNIRVGETARVKTGDYVGKEGEVIAVNADKGTAFVQTPGEASAFEIPLTSLARIVNSKTDQEDMYLARVYLQNTEMILARTRHQIARTEAEQIAEAGQRLGLPEEILKAIGLLPLINKLGLSDEAEETVSDVVGGLAKALVLLGLGEDFIDRLRGK